ncbi:hypothetical protein MTO96_002432 [Rhipicephalus appendiculatus]
MAASEPQEEVYREAQLSPSVFTSNPGYGVWTTPDFEYQPGLALRPHRHLVVFCTASLWWLSHRLWTPAMFSVHLITLNLRVSLKFCFVLRHLRGPDGTQRAFDKKLHKT